MELTDMAQQAAINALREAQPETKEEADKIVLAAHHAHVEKLYGGALPEWLISPLISPTLEKVEAEHRPEIQRRLNAAKEPLDYDQIMALVREVKKGEQEASEAAKGKHAGAEPAGGGGAEPAGGGAEPAKPNPSKL